MKRHFSYLCTNLNPMKRHLLLVMFLIGVCAAQAQHRLTYTSYAKGVEDGEKSFTQIRQTGTCIEIKSLDDEVKNPIPGYAESVTFVDFSVDSVYTVIQYPDSIYNSAYHLESEGFSNEGMEIVLGYQCTKYKTIINSNTIEIWMTEKFGFDATPMPGLGKLKGVMVRCARNGSYMTDLTEIKKDKTFAKTLLPAEMGKRITGRQMSQLRKERLVMRFPVFDDEQINFAEYQPFEKEMPYDSTVHFANGTLIVKRIQLPKIPDHYQLFAEIRQRSNGDAYDRTASVFVIPTDKAKSLMDGLQEGVDALPFIVGKDGKRYQGIKAEDNYLPPVELVRFFTSFGVGHYNDRVKIDGLEWADENLYKMEITELSDHLSGDVLIGAYIGNYDGGGHKITLNILAYPNDYEWTANSEKHHSIPLFNTCNVMEIAGQNYGRLFLTDTLEVNFEVPENATDLRLRYISTGHGGWDNGDEFNPKENVIYIDGEKMFTYTPWRCDCATFREQNPVSGNFWNGTSSSDYSRSGWCPGTATNPVYFDLKDLKPGKHSLRIAIPQGADEGESFSHWMVSGALIYNML